MTPSAKNLNLRFTLRGIYQSRSFVAFFPVFFLVLCIGCRQDSSLSLRQNTKILWLYDSKNNMEKPSESLDLWQPLTSESFDDIPSNPGARAWFSYGLPEDSDFDTLIATRCSNVIRIFQDQHLIIEKQPLITYPQSVQIMDNVPFVKLPNKSRPSRLILETFYSDKSGYRPNCHAMLISSQTSALYEFMTLEFADLAAGSIVLFMGIASILFFAVKRSRVLLYFSLFAIAMSSSYIIGSDICSILFGHLPEWKFIWHCLLTFSPIPFLLFLELIMPIHRHVAKRLALFNLALFLTLLLAYLIDSSFDYDEVRRKYLKILLLEFLVFLPFAVQSLFEKAPYAKRIGISLVIVTLAAAHDIGSLLFLDSSRAMIFPWALIGFISILVSIIVHKSILHEAGLQKAKAKLIADRNSKLQSEVDRRTSDLNRRNSELEKIHIELEDHHETLANQKDKVASIARDKDVILSRIADLRNQSIPKIFDCLQQLHLAFDDDSFSILNSHINLLVKTLEPAARQYEKTHSISKKRLLILDADRKHQRIYRMAIGGSKMDLQIVENSQDFSKIMHDQNFDLIALHHSWLKVDSEIMKSSTHSTIVVLSSEDTLKNLAMMRQNPSIAHIIPLHLPRNILQQILLIHLSKLLTSDIFGIEKYLAWGFEVKERALPSLEHDEFLVRHVREDLEKMGLQSDWIDVLAEITSCLVSIKKARALVSNWSSNSISAPLRQLRYGFDASFVAVSMDLRGTLLSQQELTVFLERHIQESESGRSLPSLARLLRLADALIINSDGDKRHELIILTFLERPAQFHQPASYFHFESR